MAPIWCKSMVNSRALMKVYPVIFVCLQTAATHILCAHNYGADAFLVQWAHFTAVRDYPRIVYADQGSQLKAASNYAGRPREDPTQWNWKKVAARAASSHTIFKFVPAGAQFRNGLAESRVKLAKQAMGDALKENSFNYAELCTFMAKVGSQLNDRPLGLRSLTIEDMVPITSNQLLLGRSTSMAYDEVRDFADHDGVNLTARQAYLEEVTQRWWASYYRQVFSNLLPYLRYRDTQRHRNFQVGDVCFLKFDGKISNEYRLCRVSSVKPDSEGVVRSLDVMLRPRDKREKRGQYWKNKRRFMPTVAQRLCLLVPAEEQDQEALQQWKDSLKVE